MVCVPQSEQQRLRAAAVEEDSPPGPAVTPGPGTATGGGSGEPPGDGEEDKDEVATCSAYDMTSRSHDTSRSQVFVKPKQTVHGLYTQLADIFGHAPESFEITLQAITGGKATVVLGPEHYDMSLREVGIKFTPNSRNSLVMSDVKTRRGRKSALTGVSAPEHQQAMNIVSRYAQTEASSGACAADCAAETTVWTPSPCFDAPNSDSARMAPVGSVMPLPPPLPPAPPVATNAPSAAPPEVRLSADQVEVEEEGQPVENSEATTSSNPPLALEFPSFASSSLIKPEASYVGLVNQAMTCYLNSLLQALFMTPEFRNALYKWEFDGKEGDTGAKSIPFQLQRLFLNLQTSRKSAVETTELTRSFGWDSSEAWQQHDVQELCRVMFDALEHKFRRTDQADLINSLYEGKMIDYVKCLECSTEKQREDKFLDIPLPVRPFGSAVAYGSVVEALRAFVQPETLDGNNQYHCDTCGKKCDAHKGLKFTKFPYLLTLHLKRFDFDYNTLHRIKLNDKVVFPELLELNSFIASETSVTPAGEESNAIKCDDSSTTDSGSALDDDAQAAETPSATTNCTAHDSSLQEDDEGIDVSCCSGPGSSSAGTLENNEKNARRSLEKGPYSYELFAIMIHSGSATGGHYYAYIKDFSTGQWFCFNDQSVSRITSDDLRKTYGGGLSRAYYSGTYSSSTNAYMLMYRQIDKQRNCEAIRQEQFPPHIKRLLQDMREQEEQERADKERQLEVTRIKVYAVHPTTGQMVDAKLYCTSDVTLIQATHKAHKQLGFEGLVAVERCRLVLYDRLQDSLEGSFDGKDGEPVCDVLAATGNSKHDLILETKKDDEPWLPHKPGSILLKVYVVDIARDEVEGPHMVRSNLSHTIPEVRAELHAALPQQLASVPAEQLVVALERYGGQARLLEEDFKTLKNENFFASNKVFVTVLMDDDPDKWFQSSKMHRLIDRFENTITLHMSLPEVDKETLEDLSIPALGQQVPDSPQAEDSTQLTPQQQDNFHISWDNVQVSPIKKEEEVAVGLSDSSSSLPETSEVSEILPADPSSARLTPSSLNLPTGAPRRPASPQWEEDRSNPEDDSTGGCASTGEQSASEDSSLTDSERTLVGDQENLLNQLSPSDETQPPFSESQKKSSRWSPQPPSAPAEEEDEEPAAPNYKHLRISLIEDCDLADPGEDVTGKSSKKSSKTGSSFNWDEDDEGGGGAAHKRPQTHYYFKATPYVEDSTKMLRVELDKRTSLPALKKQLEPHVGVPMDYFKLFRSYSSSEEFEFSGYNASYRDGEKLCIRLGRALRKGEFRGKVFQLCPGATESTKFLFDWVLAKGMLVADAKRQILDELKKKHGVEIPYERCRLRKKSWKNPGQVYHDCQRFEDSMCVVANWELFVQELPHEEVRPAGASLPELVLFVRRWRPSQLTLGPFQEVELDSTAGEELRGKLVRLSEAEGETPISADHVEIAKGQGSFPCEISVLAVNSDLEWSSPNNSLNSWPLNIFEDGHVIFYRDRTEVPKVLTVEERKEIERTESSRVRLSGATINSCSPRKERALKIYLDATPPKSRIDCEVD